LPGVSQVVLALGSNLGDRLAHLRRAVERLRPALTGVSSVYETPPWGDPGQPSYFNLVLTAADERAAIDDWRRRAQVLETCAGRIRDPERPFGPRTLDIDIIAAWDNVGRAIVRDDAVLTVPHPRAHMRPFVLVPWAELDPEAVLPGYGPVADLLDIDEVAADIPDMKNIGSLLG